MAKKSPPKPSQTAITEPEAVHSTPANWKKWLLILGTLIVAIVLLRSWWNNGQSAGKTFTQSESCVAACQAAGDKNTCLAQCQAGALRTLTFPEN